MDLDELERKLRSGDRRALARALSLVESRSPEARALVARVFASASAAKLVGITGPPGVGKSTLADALASAARRHGRNVAVLAIDPTSPFSGGALLGDRARMEASASDPEIFVRSMATRGHVGGLAGAAFEALVVLESAGKNFILVETVGAGQDEIEVAAAVDVTLVVLAPGLGDQIQASKAGILEIADILVVNKADRDGASELEEQLHVHCDGKPVLATVASRAEGVDALFQEILRQTGQRRLVESWMWNVVQERIRARIPPQLWAETVKRVNARGLTPDAAADVLLESLKS